MNMPPISQTKLGTIRLPRAFAASDSFHLTSAVSVYVPGRQGRKSGYFRPFIAAYVLDSVPRESRRSPGCDYRQALASPHPVLVHDSSATPDHGGTHEDTQPFARGLCV